ncbi:MAG TPA: Nramp family divalent metal transporter [Bryobacteraceae bacterium]|nr:Nramp family divalent metal transporter [Bryobacteraceae bacterium]
MTSAPKPDAPSAKVPEDLYALNPADIVEPPRSLGAIVRRIGPGMILCASIVGSGELIATTTLGAQVGYVALWVILLSCFIKPAVQVEMGRYTIATGETGLESFNRFPGPRWKVNWVVWGWALMVATTFFQVGAMFGGVAQVMHILVPAVSTGLWVLSFLVLTLVLLLGGGYERIEKLATLKVALFTLLTLLCALLLMRMPQYFSWAQVSEGLKFQMPPGGFTRAVAVFGLTGVGATELFMYPYWCVEKGYARFAGKADGSPQWFARARGWIRVMEVDAFASMIIYTVATIAFYLLGAGVLHGMGLVPAAGEMIPILSKMYTQTLGPWAVYLFYVGAVATLYGTIFASAAAHSRLFADMFRLMGFFRRDDYAARVRYRRGFVWMLTVVPAILYWLFREPVTMVFIGGVAQFMIIPVIGVVTLYLRHRHLPSGLASSRLRTVGVWFATAVIVTLMIAYVASLLLR